MGQFTINHIDKTMTIHQDVSDGHMSIMYDKPNWLIDMLSARIMNLELESRKDLICTLLVCTLPSSGANYSHVTYNKNWRK